MHSAVLRTVFSDVRYAIFACCIAAPMFLALVYVSEYLFTSPYLVLYVPPESVFAFVLIAVISSLAGVVTSMSAYRIAVLRSGKKQAGSGIAGSVIGASAGMCSCGSVGVAIVSAFGAAGGAATSFLTAYEVPLRLVSVAVLAATYFYTARGIRVECRMSGKV